MITQYHDHYHDEMSNLRPMRRETTSGFLASSHSQLLSQAQLPQDDHDDDHDHHDDDDHDAAVDIERVRDCSS